MPTNSDIKQQVREFYDQVGWQMVGDDLYQNAHYEDLRPVSRDYIHRCHLRISRHLKPSGRYMLDAGSGPIQYPEYLAYSQGYQYRVCADISITALREARKRIGDHGLFVVADIANLPFKPGAFEGVVSLHTIHHLPEGQHLQAYGELHRVLAPNSVAAIVNGWHSPPLIRLLNTPSRWTRRLRKLYRRIRKRAASRDTDQDPWTEKKAGTFVHKYNAAWLKRELGARMPVEILVWRSADTSVLRTYIHERLGGRALLRILFGLEERFPRFFGENGRYPLVLISKVDRTLRTVPDEDSYSVL